MSETATIHRDQATIDFLVYWGLTPKQAAVYLFIYESVRRDGTQHSTRELGLAFGMTHRGARWILGRLQEKGWIERDEGAHCSLRLKKGPDGKNFRGFDYNVDIL